jgi:signal peptidase I
MSEQSGDPWGLSRGPAQPAPGAVQPDAEMVDSSRVTSGVGAGQSTDQPSPGETPERFHTPTQARRFSLVVLAAVGLAYWFTQWPLPNLLSSHPDYDYYLAQPAVWLGVAGLAGYGWWRLEDRPRFSRLLLGIAFLVGVFHVAVLVIAGVLGDFGNSPIAGRLINYPKNLWYITTLLAGAEMARAYLFRIWRRWSERLAFLGATLVFFAISVPGAQWNPFGDVQHAFRVVGGRWVPGLALSALATFLVSFGGPGPSFAYRFALLGFEWFSPILPDLGWPVLLLLGVLTPMVSVWLVRSIYGDTAEGQRRLPGVQAPERLSAPRVPERRPPVSRWRVWTGWVVTIALVALAVLFAVGALGYHMVVVDGISMEPAYGRGDLVIVRDRVDPATLQVNDVILFREGHLPVVHRIVAIEETANGRVFTTKGDNVDTPDPPVSQGQVEGKVVFVIPEVGYLNLWLRRG